MKHISWTIATALLLAGTAGAAKQPDAKAAIAVAVADPGRPAADVARDAARKPADLLAFAGVKPGDRVLDFIMGGGYVTRILAKTVGPKGLVYAYTPDEFIKFKAQYATDQQAVAKAYANVTPLNGPLGTAPLPDKLDVAITVQNYHDMHLGAFAADTATKADAALFAALKPGGVLLVVDHVAADGSGADAPNKLHRIDPAIIKQEVTAAGFRFDGESAMYRDPADPHTASVFDPAIRGHTDQIVYRFRKP